MDDLTNTSPTIQQPLPLAFINGEAVLEKPEDLYIPPDALEVILETFEGPLDLLLYLIRKQKLDILNLPLLQITEQYMEYVEVMRELNLELAAEYLLMAAILAEIKSRLLLPKRVTEEEEDDDPRAELVRRLREYEAVKKAAEELDLLPRMQRDFFATNISIHESCEPERILPDVTLRELVLGFQSAMHRAAAFEHHQIAREVLSTRERMTQIIEMVQAETYTEFDKLFLPEEGKAGVVVTFLATLELVKESLIELTQAEPYSNIYVRLAA